jgi:hypothetical protein
MKVINTITKILIALAAVAGAVYVIATYGEKIVAWAKGVLAYFECCFCDCDCDDCTCDCDCECDCDDECGEDCECHCHCHCEETEEAPAEETVEESEPVAEESAFEE